MKSREVPNSGSNKLHSLFRFRNPVEKNTGNFRKFMNDFKKLNFKHLEIIDSKANFYHEAKLIFPKLRSQSVPFNGKDVVAAQSTVKHSQPTKIYALCCDSSAP